MNAKYMIISAAACAAAMSGCVEPGGVPSSDAAYNARISSATGSPPKTRAQVSAELGEAYREGTLHPPGEEIAYPYYPPCDIRRPLAC